MSLDCYPFSDTRSLNFADQPLAIDVAYDDDLLISIVDNCEKISVYDLNSKDNHESMRQISICNGVVIDQVAYCRRGDYLACVGHKNGLLTVYMVFGWRKTDIQPTILELGVNEDSQNIDRRDKLNCISCCQRTGNIAAGCGDTVLIYKFLGDEVDQGNIESEANRDSTDADSFHSKAETVKDNLDRSNLSWEQITNEENGSSKQYFKHLISIKLSLWALRVDLAENYLSVMSVDHVQVLKLELLALQIQADGMDSMRDDDPANVSGTNSNNFNGEIGSTSATIGTTTCSMASDTNSTATNISSFTNTDTGSGQETGSDQSNSTGMSIITMNPQTRIDPDSSNLKSDSNQSADDCITWNLNTKKLVKLPTLMHNTSANLSSFHIYHPIELLGPASESIACRVRATIYSEHYGQNQLEAVVMLCRQFDPDRDPVKSSFLQAIYLSSCEDKLRLLARSCQNIDIETCKYEHDDGGPSDKDTNLLKSGDYESLASITYIVSTLTNCFVYSLHGKKVTRTQTITNPDICLDLRPDLLNIYLLTPLGLQICSSGVCDATFRYEWSSSSDLNLSFLAIDCKRILTTSKYIVLVGCSVGEDNQCIVEFRKKPSIVELHGRIIDTVEHCNSISIRSNMLTYLHAITQLTLIGHKNLKDSNEVVDEQQEHTANLLRGVTLMLCEQLLQKKQTNVITNNRIDRSIKHLLDISMCDTKECMKSFGLATNNNSSHNQSIRPLTASQSCEDMTIAAAANFYPKTATERCYSPFTWGNWRVSSSPSRLSSSTDATRSHYSHSFDYEEDARDGMSDGKNNNDTNNNVNSTTEDDQEDDDEFERKLKFIAEIPINELIDLLSGDDMTEEENQAATACIEASINLLESQFILEGLQEKFSN